MVGRLVRDYLERAGGTAAAESEGSGAAGSDGSSATESPADAEGAANGEGTAGAEGATEAGPGEFIPIGEAVHMEETP